MNNWLPYLPQLQTSLQRPEAAVVKDLLAQLATAFPQAVYYGLRTILLSLREVRSVTTLLSSLAAASLSRSVEMVVCVGGQTVCEHMKLSLLHCEQVLTF